MSSNTTRGPRPRLARRRSAEIPRKRRLIRLCSVLSLIAAGLAGCGRSSDVMELPEAARKSLIRKKVDVEARSVKSSRPGQAPPKGRADGQRP